ncbi:MAG: hypothetical protein IPM74_11770 [Crocinitomicaceae bacterium]|nr:hypothetical protein [Crocinitomicaceae bacterium]
MGEWCTARSLDVFNKNGIISEEGEVKDGKPVGIWKYYDKKGKYSHSLTR